MMINVLGSAVARLRVDVEKLRAEVRMLRGLPPYEAAQK